MSEQQSMKLCSTCTKKKETKDGSAFVGKLPDCYGYESQFDWCYVHGYHKNLKKTTYQMKQDRLRRANKTPNIGAKPTIN